MIARDTSVSPENPSTRAPAGVKSMTRPSTNGPLSFMRTRVFRLFRLFVTSTTVPRGSSLCAAVSASSLSCSPLAVLFPDDRS